MLIIKLRKVLQIVSFFAYFSLVDISEEKITGFCAGIDKYLLRKFDLNVESIATSGSGGDELKTVNISSPASIITASCGLAVSKHGAGRVTGISGSSDWFREVGVNFDIDLKKMADINEKIRFGFYEFVKCDIFGLLAFRLLTSNIFEFVGPIMDPVNVSYKVIGAKDLDQMERYFRIFQILLDKGYLQNLQRIMIVCGSDENGQYKIDEVSSVGNTKVIDIQGNQINKYTIFPKDFGLEKVYKYKDIAIKESYDKNINATKKIFTNEADEAIRDVVLVNVATYLICGGVYTDYKEAYKAAREVVDSGKAKKLLDELGEMTNE